MSGKWDRHGGQLEWITGSMLRYICKNSVTFSPPTLYHLFILHTTMKSSCNNVMILYTTDIHGMYKTVVHMHDGYGLFVGCYLYALI